MTISLLGIYILISKLDTSWLFLQNKKLLYAVKSACYIITIYYIFSFFKIILLTFFKKNTSFHPLNKKEIKLFFYIFFTSIVGIFIGCIFVCRIFLKLDSSELLGYVLIFYEILSIPIFLSGILTDNYKKFFFSILTLNMLALFIFASFGGYKLAVTSALRALHRGNESEMFLIDKTATERFNAMHIPLYQKLKNGESVTNPIMVSISDDNGVHFKYPEHAFFYKELLLPRKDIKQKITMLHSDIHWRKDIIHSQLINISNSSGISDLIFGWAEKNYLYQFYSTSNDINRDSTREIPIGNILVSLISSYKLGQTKNIQKTAPYSCNEFSDNICFNQLWNHFVKIHKIVSGKMHPTLDSFIKDANKKFNTKFSLAKKTGIKNFIGYFSVVSTPRNLLRWYQYLFENESYKYTAKNIIKKNELPGFLFKAKKNYFPYLKLYIAESDQNGKVIVLIHVDPNNLNLFFSFHKNNPSIKTKTIINALLSLLFENDENYNQWI